MNDGLSLGLLGVVSRVGLGLDKVNLLPWAEVNTSVAKVSRGQQTYNDENSSICQLRYHAMEYCLESDDGESSHVRRGRVCVPGHFCCLHCCLRRIPNGTHHPCSWALSMGGVDWAYRNFLRPWVRICTAVVYTRWDFSLVCSHSRRLSLPCPAVIGDVCRPTQCVGAAFAMAKLSVCLTFMAVYVSGTLMYRA